MDFLTNSLFRRFGPMGRVTDAAIVGGAALKFAQRKGLVSAETAKKLGAADSSAGSSVSIGELLLVAAAAVRLLRYFRSRQDRVMIIEI